MSLHVSKANHVLLAQYTFRSKSHLIKLSYFCMLWLWCVEAMRLYTIFCRTLSVRGLRPTSQTQNDRRSYYSMLYWLFRFRARGQIDCMYICLVISLQSARNKFNCTVCVWICINNFTIGLIHDPHKYWTGFQVPYLI